MTDLSNIKAQFLLNPEITYLNFGSFGACPEPLSAITKNGNYY